MADYTGGSEWRKWDLYIHLPATKLSDGYEDALTAMLHQFDNKKSFFD